MSGFSLQKLVDHFGRSRFPNRSALLVIGLASLPLVLHARKCYIAWYALGPGGPPHNILGWVTQALLKLVGRSDLTNPSHYSRLDVLESYQPFPRTSFMPSDTDSEVILHQRTGSPPNVPYYMGPQRQITEQADEARTERMICFLEAVIRENSEVFESRPSKLEGGHTMAIWWRGWEKNSTTCPRFATIGELVHVHPEGSTHLVLGPYDAETVLRSGWGCRHPASGVPGGLPWTYVFLYAPRNLEEWEIWKSLVLAACACWVSMANGKVESVRSPIEESIW